jgi:hypothetical protein
MNIIEQRIRTYIHEQLISEADNGSGYDIKIPSTYLIGDLKRWRPERINKRAKENGCVRGFLIVATKASKTTDDSKLMADISATMRSEPGTKDYYSNDYRIVLSTPVQRFKKKIYAAWIIDLKTDEPTPFRVLLNKLQTIQSKTVYQDYQQFEKYAIGTTDIITQPQAIAWTIAIKNYLNKLKLEKPDWYKNQFPEDTDIITQQLNSIPDFTNMNRNVVPGDDVGDGTAKETVIDINWKRANGFNTSFDGTADVSVDPVSGITVLIPINGYIRLLERNTNRSGTFEGQFKNGAPYKGITEYDADVEGATTDLGNGIIGTDWTWSENFNTSFEGEYDATISTVIDQNTEKRMTFSLTNIKGKNYYNINGDIKATYFDGTYNDNTEYNGVEYTRDTPGENYYISGKITNGKYVQSNGKPATYPYKKTGNQTVYQLPDDLDHVYAWFKLKNLWGQFLTINHTKLINNFITGAQFEASIQWVTDPTLATKLSTTFKEGPNYVILKSDDKIDIFDPENVKQRAGQYDPTKGSFGRKLEWTGNVGGNMREVFMKDKTGKYLEKLYLIKDADIEKTIKYNE